VLSAECQEETVTEIAYLSAVAIVCNVCTPAVIQRLTRENNAELAFAMPVDAKARMIEAAHRLNMPVEEYLHRFVAVRPHYQALPAASSGATQKFRRDARQRAPSIGRKPCSRRAWG
jgi:hypothetical protein